MAMKMKRLLYVLLILFLLTVSGGCSGNRNRNFSAGKISLDTYVSVTLYGCGSDELANEAINLCDYYSGIFSRTDNNSLLYKLNEKGSMEIAGEEERILADVIKQSVRMCDVTDGALDIAIEPLTCLWDFKDSDVVPDASDIENACGKTDYTKIRVTDTKVELNGTRLDLGAVAKGYVADSICDFLRQNGVNSAVVSLGGNVACIGKKPDGKDFTIGVQKPFGEQSEVSAVLLLDDMSAVTSGVYERYFYIGDKLYHHILDPDTGMPSESGLLSVTIISDNSFRCDGLSTGCFVMGKEKAIKLLDGMEGVYGIFIDKDYNITYSEGAESFLKK